MPTPTEGEPFTSGDVDDLTAEVRADAVDLAAAAIDQTDLDLLAPKADPTFTGVATAPAFAVSGLTGSVAASRYVGATASGAPASGAHLKGDFVIDQTGKVWVCTVAGTPGTWVSSSGTIALGVACSDETTALTTGTAKATFRMPYAMTLTAVRATVTTAPTGASLLTVDVNEAGTTILSTKLTIDASEKTSVTAATPPVISDAALADDAEITVDIDQIGSTIAGAGLKVWLIGTKA